MFFIFNITETQLHGYTFVILNKDMYLEMGLVSGIASLVAYGVLHPLMVFWYKWLMSKLWSSKPT